MLRSFFTMYRMDIGIDTSRLVVTGMIIPATKYAGWEDRTRFLQRIDEHFATVSAIEAASTASAIPFSGGGAARRLEVDGRAATPGERLPEVTMLSVGSRYFDVIGVPLLRGRVFTNEDGGPDGKSRSSTSASSISISRARIPSAAHPSVTRRHRLHREAEWLTVVGLVPNVRQRNNNQEREPIRLCISRIARTPAWLARRMSWRAHACSDPAQATKILREAMMGVDPDQALATPRTMDEALAQNRWLLRVFTTMFSIFAVMALVLAAVGLYAVTAYAVTQHTRDIGVRMVLGAQPGQVIWLFLRRSIVQLAIGLTIGVAAAFGLGQRAPVVSRPDEFARPCDADRDRRAAYVVAFAASVGPARRATRLDPLHALRHE